MKYRSKKSIEQRAVQLLEEHGAMRAPVPVELIAHRLGLVVESAALGNDVSGLLVVKDGRGTIGVNQTHVPVRQRFTIAHEIGHYVLHREEAELFIDKGYAAARRDRTTSTGEDYGEIQANAFAAALLMPEPLVSAEVDRLAFDLGDEDALEALADKFQVSLQAMTFRLSNLEIF